MNCNTTHYRANSSSVPGDPTHRAHYEVIGAGGAESGTDPVGADGVLSLVVWAPGPLRAAIAVDGYAAALARAVVSDEADAAPVEVVLEPGRRARGRLVGPDGKPIARAEISLDLGDPEFGAHRTESGEDGRFELDGLPPRARLRVRAEGRAERALDVPPAPDGLTDLGDVALEPDK